MKVLITASVAGSWPYLPEMVEELTKYGARAEVFDIDELGPLGLSTKIAFRLRRLQYAATLRQIKKRLARLPADYDAINIQFAAPIYRDLAPILKKHGKKLVTTIWGSDFLRAGPSELRALGETLVASDVVTTNNPHVFQKLVAFCPEIEQRTRVVRWGLRSLDVIAALRKKETQQDTRKKLGLPPDRTIITCGYNGGRAQQHAVIIDALARLSPRAKAVVYALLPMTYSTEPAYTSELLRLLESAQIKYRVIDKMVSLEEVGRIRIASDYAVNVQTTDSLSASLQEHMFAGSRMIVGNWLPYTVFEQIGVPLYRVENARDITAVLESTLDISRSDLIPAYSDRLYEFASWSSNIGNWIQAYR